MKIKFGAIVVAGSGKIGGHVASRNRTGAYLRTKVTPVNPNTSYQTLARSRLTGLAQAWRGLTASQRLAWNALRPETGGGGFDPPPPPPGFTTFNSWNNNLIQIGESALDDPPTLQSIANITSFSMTVVTGTPAITLTFAPAIEATEKVKVFATAPQSAGKSFVKSEYRLIDVLTSADTSPHVATTEYVARFGSVGATGLKIFFKLVPVSVASGQEGIGITASAISTAS